ncbi:MAG TPA: 3-hydroxyacyl-[acyl-carrier-protein] dehydratase FabZ [Rhodospirillaceae bacterium]|nr:3-hydroxyacyl-[acyl-carrier-protein] dehydratase FabZ [Rhodospirillaceae bacterium]MBL25424.1 3-hydroxyacyl-[acyl-carrier-protein] dehydratase FabZ [Rhodospirillaceae bacterium]HAA91621.1 3-hydroxyacyl-[acyl-carrier-protein] dehydratase FabZ [Rhodospirillaceae bacterium]HAT36080.1 3-hydroxyacyl-[acyl-carrier-protein] dehydratase FabZ [Rhodospirillaceae bacterium]
MSSEAQAIKTISEADPEVIDIQEIMDLLPHRYPFLLIDKIIDVIGDERATGIKCVSVSEPFFQGHFPEQPIMPGVLIIEAMAQTAAAIVVRQLPEAEGQRGVYFMTIENARFRRPVGPGDTLHLQVKKIRQRGKVWKFSGDALVDGQVAAEATYTAMIVEDQ